MTGKVEG